MRVGVVGTRKFSDYELMKKELDKIEPSVIVSGGAKGADQLGERYALEKNIPTEIFLPDWDQYGKQAGFIRNKKIVDNSDMVIAFWDGKSKGTSHSIYLARNSGKNVKVVRYAD